MPDVAVVGSGPNGLAAAVTLARAGLKVHVYEAAPAPGGGLRTAELMEPGHFHDVCSAVHPMALASPFFRQFELSRRIRLEVPDVSYGTPLDGGRAALAYRSLERTVAGLGRDGGAFGRLMAPLVQRADGVADLTLNQLLRLPRDPVAAALFGVRVLEQGSPLWGLRFREELAPALLTGVAAHAVAQLPAPAPAGAGLMLGTLAHTVGWPVPVGGSAAIAQAMVADIEAHGGAVETGARIGSLAELPPVRATLLDVAPPGLLRLADGRLPDRYRRALESFRFGNAACKVDFILSGPVPWAASGLADAGTVHVGGTRAEMAEAENLVAAGRHPDRPYVLVSQPSRFDAGRAPGGRHILWSYCHVPAGSTVDMAGGSDRPAGALRPGIPGPCRQSSRHDCRRTGRVQRKLRRRGLQRRPDGPPGDHPAARTGSGSLADSPARRVPVFLLHAPGPRRDRHAGIPCRKICLEGHIRPRGSAASESRASGAFRRPSGQGRADRLQRGEPAVAHAGHRVRQRDEAGVVGDHDRSHAELVGDPAQQPHDCLAPFPVQGCRWFVHQQHGRIPHQGAGNIDPLPLSAGELVGPFAGCRGQANEIQERCGAAGRLPCRLAAQVVAYHQLFQGREGRQQVGLLEDDADPCPGAARCGQRRTARRRRSRRSARGPRWA